MAVTSKFREAHRERIEQTALARTMISCSSNHIVGLKSDGTVVACGDNSHGQCNVSQWQDVVQVFAGQNMTLGLKADGTALCTDENADVLEDRDFVKKKDLIYLCAYPDNVLGIHKNGTVYEVNNDHPTTYKLNNVAKLLADEERYVYMTHNGEAGYGELYYTKIYAGDWKAIVDIAMCGEESIGLRADGAVVCTEDTPMDYHQSQISQWERILALFGRNPFLGLQTDGTLITPFCPDEDGRDPTWEVVSAWQDVVAADVCGSLYVALHGDGTVSVYEADPESDAAYTETAQWKLFDRIEMLDVERQAVVSRVEHQRQEERNALQRKILALQKERAKLGFFDGRKKKEIDTQIRALNDEMRRT